MSIPLAITLLLLGAGIGNIFGGSKKEKALPPEVLQSIINYQPQPQVPETSIYAQKMPIFLNRVADLFRKSDLSPYELTIALDIVGKMVAPFMGTITQRTENPLDTQLKIERLKRLQAQNALSQMMLSNLNNPNINQENLQKALQLK